MKAEDEKYAKMGDYSSLLRRIKAALPMVAYISASTGNRLRKQGTLNIDKLTMRVRCKIRSVIDGKEIGGILCDLRMAGVEEKVPVLMSITQLEFTDQHPLRDEINQYIKDRKAWLRVHGRGPISTTVELK